MKRTRIEPLPDGDVDVSTGRVRVEREQSNPNSVTLYLDSVPSSHLDLADPLRLDFEYMQHMLAAIDWAVAPPRPLAVVHLGGGACALPRAIDHGRPGSRQIVAEVDGELARMVRLWFDLPRSPRLRIRVADGLEVLASRPEDSADVVIRDAFAPNVVPPHLTATPYLEHVARVLRSEGLYVANCAGPANNPASHALLRSEIAGARSLFADVALIAEPGVIRGRRHGNVVLLGAPRPLGHFGDVAELERALRRLTFPAQLVRGEEVERFAAGAKPVRA